MSLASRYGVDKVGVKLFSEDGDKTPSAKPKRDRPVNPHGAPEPDSAPSDEVGVERIAGIIRAAIDEAGSRKAFATRCGVSPQFIGRVASGAVPPSPAVLDAIGYEAVTVTHYRERGK